VSRVEEEVISYIALEGDLLTVTGAGIGLDHFLDPDNRRVFADIIAFQQDYAEAPTAEAILRDHPNFEFVAESSGPITYLLKQLHKARIETLVELGMGAAGDAMDKDGPEAALAVLRVMQTQVALASAESQEIDYAQTGSARLETYRKARENPGEMLGIPTGFVFLDKVTNGIQPQQFIVLTGLAKSCKTTVMLGMARTAYDYGVKPLILSFEMPYAEIARRMDGFRYGVNPSELLKGNLADRDWRRLERELLTVEKDKSLIFTEDRAGATTLSGIQAKIEKVSPDVLFVDGAYFLRDEITGEVQTPLALTNISRGLRRLALSHIPIVVTTQSLSHKVGAKGLTANSLGYTSAWVQDADLVVGMEPTDEDHEYRMKVLLSRNAIPQDHLISIHWDPPRFEEAPLEEANEYPY
jgi:hypothetical protein